MNSYCNKIRPLLSEYVDDMLDPRRTSELDAHLASCTDCREIVADFRTNKSVMSSIPLRQTSTSFDSALAARIAAINEQRAKKSWLARLGDAFRPSRTNVWRPAFASMAAVGVVACSVVFTFPHDTGGPAIQPTADKALIQQCVAQHRNYVESQPLSDFSAQTLAGQLDNTQGETDDDDTL